MAKQNSYFILEMLKLICIALLKIAALLLAFVCKILSFLLEKVSEIIEQLVGYGKEH